MITPILDLYLQIVYTKSPEIQFEWDEDKRRANIAKHGFNFTDVGPAFVDPMRVVYPVENRNLMERRWVLLGRIEGRVMHVVFTVRGNRIRLISVRLAHEKERALYGK